MSETWSERCLKHEALYTRDESAMCPICEVHSLRAQLAAKGREPVPMREALLEIRVALEFNRTALALRKANDAIAAPAEEEKRRLPIICTNCGEEWSDGHAETCEPTLAAPAEETKA